MNLWGRLKRFTVNSGAKALFAARTIGSNRKSLFRWLFGLNVGFFIIVLLPRSDQFNEIITKQVQFISETRIPIFLRPHIYRLYSKYYGANIDQIQLPLREYENFCSFFTRKINRKYPEQKDNMIASPCDGKILSFSQITEDKCQIIKGKSYILSQLVLDESIKFLEEPIQKFLKKNKQNKLYQIVIYLAPGDYHRFHSPADVKILKKIQIPGRCDSVSESALSKGKCKYQKNGRVSMFSEWRGGLLTMVMVGALNVSRIHFGSLGQAKKGDQLGYFNLGSTIVLVVEAKGVKEWKINEGAQVRYGDPLFEYML